MAAHSADADDVVVVDSPATGGVIIGRAPRLPTEEDVSMRMYVAGQWIDKSQTIPVENPYDRSVIDTVPRADRGDVERALESAVRGARAMAKLTGYERHRILHKAAQLIAARQEELGRLICMEEGKILAEGRLEASRAFETL